MATQAGWVMMYLSELVLSLVALQDMAFGAHEQSEKPIKYRFMCGQWTPEQDYIIVGGVARSYHLQPQSFASS